MFPEEPPDEPVRTGRIFDSVSAARIGTTYTDVLGVTTHRLTGNCLVQSGTGSLFARFDTPIVLCTRRTPRRDLFDDIRPSYLPEQWRDSP